MAIKILPEEARIPLERVDTRARQWPVRHFTTVVKGAGLVVVPAVLALVLVQGSHYTED